MERFLNRLFPSPSFFHCFISFSLLPVLWPIDSAPAPAADSPLHSTLLSHSLPDLTQWGAWYAMLEKSCWWTEHSSRKHLSPLNTQSLPLPCLYPDHTKLSHRLCFSAPEATCCQATLCAPHTAPLKLVFMFVSAMLLLFHSKIHSHTSASPF